MPRFFGEKLRHLRLQHSLSQSNMAQRLAIKRAHANNIEAGRRLPSLAFVLRAANLFRVTTDYLVRDTIAVEEAVSHQYEKATVTYETFDLFGAKLRSLRLIRGLTQTEVAQQLGLASHSHISFLEMERKEPSIDLVVQIADVFGVTTDYLLRDSIPVGKEDQRDG
jgi:transcriptional regulator with XRE-family HTH domain